MTIQEAIEVLEKAQEATNFVGEHPLRSAQKLGIEALKRLQREKDEIPDALWNPLPGETKD